ncbi:MAG TPA: glycosyltransferase [Pyrinomonadaceae bacterium]|nr:glycosyltransferase [Pyrinomonadaceae bacterium]
MSLRVKDLEVDYRTPAIAAVDVKEKKRELRVLQVFSSLGVGGAETWLISLLKYFHENQEGLDPQICIDVLLTGVEKGVFDDEARSLGARLFYVPFERRRIVTFIREFRRILASGHYDAIHDHQDYIAGLHFLMGLGHLPPIRVAHVHNPLYHRTSYADGSSRRLAQSAGKRLLSKLATHVMGTSRQIVSEYGFDSESFRKIELGTAHCGFNAKQYLGNPKGARAALCQELGWDGSARIILFVGRLESTEVVHCSQTMTHKNPAFALEIVRECIARDPGIHLAMVGSGESKRREFETRVNEWGLARNIRLLGVRFDVPKLMLGSDLLLFPSLAEGLGMVVVEAQAAGLRVLASDSTPRECVVIPDLVEFQSLSKDAEVWAEQALHLIGLPHPDLSICNAAVRESAFSVENSAALLLELYAGNEHSTSLSLEELRIHAHS